MLYHLTHLTYNREEYIYKSRFNLLDLPTELLLQVISYLDYQELCSLSYCNKLLYQLVSQQGKRYLCFLRFYRIKPNLNFFLASRPTVAELYERRILRHRFLYILIQPNIWSRLEMFELLLFMLKRKSLNKLLLQRPTRSELIKRGILKPPKFNKLDELDSDFINCMDKPVLTRCIATKIKKLQNYEIEQVLKNFLDKYYNSKYGFKKMSSDRFLDKLNYFEKLAEDDQQVVEMMNGGKKRKRILQLNVIGNKVFFN